MQLPCGHNIAMIGENGAMLLNATLLDRSDMRTCDMVAPVVPIRVLAAVAPKDETREARGNLADFDAPKCPCWMEHVK